VDPVLGPEMRATGEVMGIADTFAMAFYKAQDAAGTRLPLEGNVLLTVADGDKTKLLPVARKLAQAGYTILATQGTSQFLQEKGVASTLIKKLHEGRPNIGDAIKNGEIQLIINTPLGRTSKVDDSYIRILAIQYKLPYVTSIAAAQASVEGMIAAKQEPLSAKALQDYHAQLTPVRSPAAEAPEAAESARLKRK